ncbi:MAG TPA: hypothetical protein VFR93_05870 [Candidatus Limnocylindrales bacterium]|nr:hypothetical protein [Candidatus Limnocylindrales bacterium]
MAIYEGARPRPFLRPTLAPRVARPAGRTLEAPALPRRRLNGAVRARRRSNRVGVVLGAIVVVFLLAFFSLAQTMRVSATGYDIERLNGERDGLLAEQRQAVSDISRLGGISAVRHGAIELGLTQLTDPLIVRPK